MQLYLAGIKAKTNMATVTMKLSSPTIKSSLYPLSVLHGVCDDWLEMKETGGGVCVLSLCVPVYMFTSVCECVKYVNPSVEGHPLRVSSLLFN